MYNCKVYNYGSELQYRFYKNIVKNKKTEEQFIQDKKTSLRHIGVVLTDKKEVDVDRSVISSLNRTVNKIYEYSRSNEWEYFVTLTFNNKINRFNYDEVVYAMKSFIDNIRRTNKDMKYILVPELHKNGAYHFHGLFSNIPNIKMIDSDIYSYGKYTFKKENIPDNLINKCRLIYNMDKYNYGYSDIQHVENTKKAANYITKYITKELVISSPNKKRYWNSKNLNKPLVTEMLLNKEQKEKILKYIDDHVINKKVIDIEIGTYTNKIEYFDVDKI